MGGGNGCARKPDATNEPAVHLPGEAPCEAGDVRRLDQDRAQPTVACRRLARPVLAGALHGSIAHWNRHAHPFAWTTGSVTKVLARCPAAEALPDAASFGNRPSRCGT